MSYDQLRTRFTPLTQGSLGNSQNPFQHIAQGNPVIGDPGQAISDNAAHWVPDAAIGRAGGNMLNSAMGQLQNSPMAQQMKSSLSNIMPNRVISPPMGNGLTPVDASMANKFQSTLRPNNISPISNTPISQNLEQRLQPQSFGGNPVMNQSHINPPSNVTNNFSNTAPGNTVVRQYGTPPAPQQQSIGNINQMMDGGAVRPQGFQSVPQTSSNVPQYIQGNPNIPTPSMNNGSMFGNPNVGSPVNNLSVPQHPPAVMNQGSGGLMSNLTGGGSPMSGTDAANSFMNDMHGSILSGLQGGGEGAMGSSGGLGALSSLVGGGGSSPAGGLGSIGGLLSSAGGEGGAMGGLEGINKDILGGMGLM